MHDKYIRLQFLCFLATDPGNGNWVRHAKCPWSSLSSFWCFEASWYELISNMCWTITSILYWFFPLQNKRNPSNAKAAPSAQELLRQSGRSCNLFLKFCFRCNLLFPFFRATGSLSGRESWHGWPSGSTPWVTSRSTSLPSRPGIAVRRGTARDGGGGEREATDWRTNKEVLNAL